jgi:hypothetical protein
VLAAGICRLSRSSSRGTFVGLGRKLDLRNITCPLYLLGGASDDITTPDQVLGAKNYVGTPKERILEKIVPGGLFHGIAHLEGKAGNRAMDRCSKALIRSSRSLFWGFVTALAEPPSDDRSSVLWTVIAASRWPNSARSILDDAKDLFYKPCTQGKRQCDACASDTFATCVKKLMFFISLRLASG